MNNIKAEFLFKSIDAQTMVAELNADYNVDSKSHPDSMHSFMARDLLIVKLRNLFSYCTKKQIEGLVTSEEFAEDFKTEVNSMADECFLPIRISKAEINLN
jgi:hypothetical protein